MPIIFASSLLMFPALLLRPVLTGRSEGGMMAGSSP